MIFKKLYKLFYIAILTILLLTSCAKVQDDNFETIESSEFLSNEIIPNSLRFTYFDIQQNSTNRTFVSNEIYVVP